MQLFPSFNQVQGLFFSIKFERRNIFWDKASVWVRDMKSAV